jgi:tRNA A37 threonylcarbamoyladenosine synthetase subunit TsaC/SUA5/YrdC
MRVPDHPLMLELLRMLDFPLAAPSANPFCYISPPRVDHGLGRTINERLHKAAGKKMSVKNSPFQLLKYSYPIPD